MYAFYIQNFWNGIKNNLYNGVNKKKKEVEKKENSSTLSLKLPLQPACNTKKVNIRKKHTYYTVTIQDEKGKI